MKIACSGVHEHRICLHARECAGSSCIPASKQVGLSGDQRQTCIWPDVILARSQTDDVVTELDRTAGCDGARVRALSPAAVLHGVVPNPDCARGAPAYVHTRIVRLEASGRWSSAGLSYHIVVGLHCSQRSIDGGEIDAIATNIVNVVVMNAKPMLRSGVAVELNAAATAHSSDLVPPDINAIAGSDVYSLKKFKICGGAGAGIVYDVAQKLETAGAFRGQTSSCSVSVGAVDVVAANAPIR